MKEKLPVVLENLDLPFDEMKERDERDDSRGFVRSIVIIGIVIVTWSIAAILFLMNR